MPDVPTPEPTDPPVPTKDPVPSMTPIPSPTATPALPEVTTEPTSTPAQESGTVFTVDKSGETDISKNQYKTIREALASAAEKSPSNESERITIEVVPGTYREQLVVNTPYITIKKKPGTDGEVLCTWYYGTGTMYKNCGSDGFYQRGIFGRNGECRKELGSNAYHKQQCKRRVD